MINLNNIFLIYDFYCKAVYLIVDYNCSKSLRYHIEEEFISCLNTLLMCGLAFLHTQAEHVQKFELIGRRLVLYQGYIGYFMIILDCELPTRLKA